LKIACNFASTQPTTVVKILVQTLGRAITGVLFFSEAIDYPTTAEETPSEKSFTRRDSKRND
jgi:hypothetical protein